MKTIVGEHLERHALIEEALKLLEMALSDLGSERATRAVKGVLEFLRMFGRAHHAVEEEALFPLLDELGHVERGLTELIKLEHKKIEERLATLEKAWKRYESRASGEFAELAKDFIAVNRNHKYGEDVLLRRAEGALGSEQRELHEKYLQVEKEFLGKEGLGKYVELIGKLKSLF